MLMSISSQLGERRNGFTDKVYVQKGRDWENKKNTIIFTGLNNQGTAVWGKKK